MNILKSNKLSFLMAAIVGLIYIAPNIIFIASLDDNYKGIPMMQTANEDFYLARIQEVLDGHPSLGSPAFFEYKDQIPLSPPTGEFIYAVPSLIFNVSPVNILIASRFFLPFILFLLVYFLILRLTDTMDSIKAKINAIAGALFVTLGYDLIDFRALFNYLKGISASGDFLIWSRPVNPILGAIFLISFLIFLWCILQNQEIKRQKLYIAGASIFLALMITNYFFSWGIAVSVAAALVLIYFFKKEYKPVKNLIIVVIFGFLLSSPYWYFAFKASQSPWYHNSALRDGLFYTHYPIFNKLMLAVLFTYLILIFLQNFKLREKKITMPVFQNWHWFCLALILGSLWVYIQQIATGMTIWPYHFVQYTIPLAIIVLMVLFYRIINEKSHLLWKAGTLLIILSSLSFGIYAQASAYKEFYHYYSNLQSYAPLFDWINQQEKDCVILVKDNPKEGYSLNGLILSFTHCNVYNSTWLFSIIPDDRIRHNYLVRMLFNGATAQNAGKYLEEHKREPQGYLFANWKELYSIKDFPDVVNNVAERLKKLPEDYKKFVTGDLKSELKKYKLDYILIKGQTEGLVSDLLKGLEPIYFLDDIVIYKF